MRDIIKIIQLRAVVFFSLFIITSFELVQACTQLASGQVKVSPTDFIPEGFVLFEQISGDLNNDGLEDCVLIIKATDKNNMVRDQDRRSLDRNRRGIIVLFYTGDEYELALQNEGCFSSEHEDGGVYFAPELSVGIENGDLYMHYGHGRYGYWTYTFRFLDSDMELIRYDTGYRSDLVSDWVTFDETNLDLIGQKKRMKKVTHVTADGKEELKESCENIRVERVIKLSEISDFDRLDITKIVHIPNET